MCKNKLQFHSWPELEIISLDAGLRLDGISSLDSSDLIVSVFGNTIQNHDITVDLFKNEHEVFSPTNASSQRVINYLNNVDLVTSNVQSSHQEALLYVFEDNEAVIKMIIKATSPTMRHVSRITWTNQFEPWNPNQTHQHQKPSCHRRDQRKIPHVMNGNIFCVCPRLTISFQFYRVFWSKFEMNAKRLRWRKSHSKVEADDDVALHQLRPLTDLCQWSDTMAPTVLVPMIEYMTVSPWCHFFQWSDMWHLHPPTIEFMVLALGVSNGGGAPVTELCGTCLGASDDGPAPLLTNDITRCVNDLKKPGYVSSLIPELEGRLLSLWQARCHWRMCTDCEMSCCSCSDCCATFTATLNATPCPWWHDHVIEGLASAWRRTPALDVFVAHSSKLRRVRFPRTSLFGKLESGSWVGTAR